jgi:cytoskeletal protein CcmA (bactofilin family)
MNINKIFAYIFIVILLSGFALAEKDSFTLSEEYGKNLYLTNNIVTIDSNLYGDLFAFSEKMDVNALVQQDLNAVAGMFDLKGTIGSDLRLVASSAKIDGTVFGEVMILGDYVEFTNNSQIGGPVNINANTVIIDGDFKDNLNINADKVIINGIVEGNAVIYSTSLELGPNAKILGDFSSTRSIDGMSSKVGGIITKMNGREDPNNFTSVTFRKIWMFITLFLIGAVLVLVARKFTNKSVEKMSKRFFLSLLFGFLALLITPFIAVALLFTVVGIPISIILVLIYILAIILSLGLGSLFIGKLLVRIANKKNKDVWIALLIGTLFIALISLIPIVLCIIIILLMFTAIGAGLIAIFGKDKKK